MYGVQPFYMYQSVNTEYVGVFNLNSYATDYVIDYNAGVNTAITNIMIGGMIQKFFFRGAKPDHVITKYERLTGMPTVPPMWAFGW
jgi:alpha-glucosidase